MTDETFERISNKATPHTVSFFKGSRDEMKTASTNDTDWEAFLLNVKKQLSEAMNARHLSFLLGAGCSSYHMAPKPEDTPTTPLADPELGIPVMAPMAKEFISGIGSDKNWSIHNDDVILLKARLGLDLKLSVFESNLEKLMEVLFGFQHSLTFTDKNEDILDAVNNVIGKIEIYILFKCEKETFAEPDNSVISVYKNFYRKLSCRDRSLPRPWVFTTNYDLFNERAMDSLSIPYCNGFTGVIDRSFNPATFRQALAEQMDISSRKWSVAENFMYFAKLHGSISWTDREQGLYPIREVQGAADPSDKHIMIYPTPRKQGASLGSPYADIFREFHNNVVTEQSVLFVAGYGFGDEHINNIIYQALSIPTFRLVIFSDTNFEEQDCNKEIKRLYDLGDPRIWIVGGKTPKGDNIHFFKHVVDDLLPTMPSDDADTAIQKAIDVLVDSQRFSDGGTA